MYCGDCGKKKNQRFCMNCRVSTPNHHKLTFTVVAKGQAFSDLFATYRDMSGRVRRKLKSGMNFNYKLGRHVFRYQSSVKKVIYKKYVYDKATSTTIKLQVDDEPHHKPDSQK